MATKKRDQIYFYVYEPAPVSNLNRVETEIEFFLQREDCRAWTTYHSFTCWLERLAYLCTSLNSVNNRCADAAVVKKIETLREVNYQISRNISIKIYKSKI
jgi:hypothetical protein